MAIPQDKRLVTRHPPVRPTMSDIAAQVGISVKSVSRVLNGEPGVSAATAERILATAAELGFRRNDLARNLRRGDRTETIGLVLRHSSTRLYDDLIRGVEDVADQHGALVLTASSRSPERERNTLLALSSRRVDGLLIVPTGDDQSFLRSEQSAGLPLVFVDRPPAGLTADTVLADDAGGGRAATEHLLMGGHRRIGVIGSSPRLHTVAERLRGYRTALDRQAIAPDPTLLELGANTVPGAQAAASRLLAQSDPPTALFTLNSLCTIGVARALRDAQVSRQVALVGFDDFPLADLLDPPVTVVEHDVFGMGRIGAERLFARIDGQQGPPEAVVLATGLVPRGSGEIPGPNPLGGEGDAAVTA